MPSDSTTTTATTTTATTTRKRHLARWLILAILAVVAIGAALWFSGVLKPPVKVALVTGGRTPYWDMVLRGANDSARRHRVRLATFTPPSDERAQTQAIQALQGKGYDGIAVSALEPVRQADLLADLAAEAPLVTFDSDCPVARRLCFVGTDNYEAGRLAARHIREAIPDGGDVIIAVGSLEKSNGQQRRQGLIEELLERPPETPSAG